MLLMVLVFVMVVGLALGALLPYTQVGVSEAGVARDVRSTQNAVDGAMQGAIAQVRRDLEQGNERSNRCDDYSAADYPAPVGTANVNVTVTCKNALGGAGGGSSIDTPPYAIITTGSDMTVSGGNTLGVDGGVYVSGAINTIGSSKTAVVVIGDAYSTTNTCGKVTGTGKICPPTGIPSLPAVDFPSALGDTTAAAQTAIDGLAKDPLGTCTSKHSIVTFVPGYYSEPPTPGPSCTSKSNDSNTWWFSPCEAYPGCTAGATSPGVYVFGFPDAAYGGNYTNVSAPTTGPGSFLDLDKKKIGVIGGSLIGAFGSSTSEAALLAAAKPGHRCDPDKMGVQVVLAGPSRIETGINSELELCASQTSATSLQRIAVYGLSPTYGTLSPAGPRSRTNTALNAGQPATSPATTTTGDAAFKNISGTSDNPDGARTAGDGLNVAVGSFTGAATTYGATLTDFPSVPDGSLVSNAWVDVTHLETDNRLNPQLKITYSSGKTDTCNLTSTITSLPSPLAQSAFTTDRIDLMGSSCSGTLAKAATRWKELNPDPTDPTKKLTITYEVPGSNAVVGQKAIVDGVQLETEVVKPGLEAERCDSGSTAGCVVDAYSNSGSTATNNTYFVGTLYIPSGDLNVVVHNSPNTIFQRGVIVFGVTIDANASSTQTDPPFQLPHSPVRNRTVLFTATSDGRVRLRALVHFVDCQPAPACETTPNAPGNLVWPGKLIQVKEWTTLQ
jgi:hypothetical protein